MIDQVKTNQLAKNLTQFIETGEVAAGLFAPDVFCDLLLPVWRIQAAGVKDVVALRNNTHAANSKVTSSRCDATAAGFVLEVEERWEQEGKSWYCREILRVDVADNGIAALSIYCTGDWPPERQAQHSREVRLIRP